MTTPDIAGVLKYPIKLVFSGIPGPDQLNVRLSPPPTSSCTILIGYSTPAVKEIVPLLFVV